MTIIYLSRLLVAWTVSLTFFCSSANGHTLEDLKTVLMEIPDPLMRITNAYETAQPGEIRSRLHVAQHEMILTHQQEETKLKCVELLGKIPALERKLQKFQTTGNAAQVEEVHVMIDKAKALATVHCPAPPK